MTYITELITNEEMKIMETYFRWYGRCNGESPMLVEDYLNIAWLPAKRKFLLDVFGGKLIHKIPVEYQTPMGEIYEKLNEKLKMCPISDLFAVAAGRVCNIVIKTHFDIYHFLLEKYERYSLLQEELVSEEDKFLFEMKSVCGMLTDMSYFANNKVTLHNNVKKFRIPNTDKYIKVQQDEKPFKFINSLFKQLNSYLTEEERTKLEEKIEEARLLHSQILNTKTLKGNLCLSIHPLDYITMSMNDCDWSSCMNWDCGEFRAGTLEMMNSSSGIVAYLESDSQMFITNELKWNNKKWRCLFVLNEDFVCSSRQYPYANNTLTETALNILADMMQKYDSRIKYEDQIFNSEGYSLVLPANERGNERSIALYTYQHMYNDIENNPFKYKARKTEEELERSEHHSFEYSGPARCLICGSLIHEHDHLVCNNCADDIFYCANCGERIHEDEVYYAPDGEALCYHCYDHAYRNCHNCEVAYEEDATPEVHLLYKHNPNTSTPVVYTYNFCPHCFAKLEQYTLTIAAEDYEKYGIRAALPWYYDEQMVVLDIVNMPEKEIVKYFGYGLLETVNNNAVILTEYQATA